MNKYDYIIYIGRFQPPHLAHIEIMKNSLKIADKLIVLIGSAHQPKTIKNPWSWLERAEMIRLCLEPDYASRLYTKPLVDVMYNDQQWATNVQQTVLQTAGPDAKIAITGHSKDESSYYLKMFPQWDFVEVGNIEDIHASDVREALFTQPSEEFDLKVGRNLPHPIHAYLKAFTMKDDFEQLVREHSFIEKYKSAWESAPYLPTFQTADAVVIQSGHVLLVRRRAEPGAGLWAIPGGFVNQNEFVKDAAIRELREETKLKVPEPVLRGSIKAQEMFDHPKRSLRGRTITVAYLIELPSGPLPKVKGSDDADKAKWVPLSVVEQMEEQLFEDHYSIIQNMVGKL